MIFFLDLHDLREKTLGYLQAFFWVHVNPKHIFLANFFLSSANMDLYIIKKDIID